MSRNTGQPKTIEAAVAAVVEKKHEPEPEPEQPVAPKEPEAKAPRVVSRAIFHNVCKTETRLGAQLAERYANERPVMIFCIKCGKAVFVADCRWL